MCNRGASRCKAKNWPIDEVKGGFDEDKDAEFVKAVAEDQEKFGSLCHVTSESQGGCLIHARCEFQPSSGIVSGQEMCQGLLLGMPAKCQQLIDLVTIATVLPAPGAC